MNRFLFFSLGSAIVGLVFLYLYAGSLVKIVEISSINWDMIGRPVAIDGYIASKFISQNNNTFFSVDDGSDKITVVFFKPMEAEQFDNVEIIGTVNEYEGKLDIIGRELKIKP